MSSDLLNKLQFQYHPPEMGANYHKLSARLPVRGETGTMLWSSKGILNIGVDSDLQRRGIATAMWEEGHRLAGEQGRIPRPRHSPERTKAGDAWARAVGGPLPRLTR